MKIYIVKAIIKQIPDMLSFLSELKLPSRLNQISQSHARVCCMLIAAILKERFRKRKAK